MIDENLTKVLKRVEIFAAIGLVVALSFRIFQIPFSGPLTVFSVPTLAFIYAYGGFILLKNKTSVTENKFLLVVTVAVLSIGLIGITFKLMFWPNAVNMLLVANILLPLAICVAVWFKFNSAKETAGDYNAFLLRVVLVYAFAALLYVTPNATLIALQHRGDPEMIRLKTQSYEHPENKEYRKQLDEYQRTKRSSGSSTDTIR